MKRLLLFSSISIIMAAQARPIKNPTITIDASQLPPGYSVEYHLSGKVVSIERDSEKRLQMVDKNINSRNEHHEKLHAGNDRRLKHELAFDVDDETLSNKNSRIRTHFIYTIFDETGKKIKSSTIDLHSHFEHNQITISSRSLSSNGQPNFLVLIGDTSEARRKKLLASPKE